MIKFENVLKEFSKCTIHVSGTSVVNEKPPCFFKLSLLQDTFVKHWIAPSNKCIFIHTRKPVSNDILAQELKTLLLPEYILYNKLVNRTLTFSKFQDICVLQFPKIYASNLFIKLSYNDNKHWLTLDLSTANSVNTYLLALLPNTLNNLQSLPFFGLIVS